MNASVNSTTRSAIGQRADRLKFQWMATEAAKRVGQRILQARREMGLNQRELAERFKTGEYSDWA